MAEAVRLEVGPEHAVLEENEVVASVLGCRGDDAVEGVVACADVNGARARRICWPAGVAGHEDVAIVQARQEAPDATTADDDGRRVRV